MTKRHETSGKHEYNVAAGKLVEDAMREKGVTQTALAEMVGLSQSALSRKMSGVRGWDIGELIEVAAILDVPITDLIPSRLSGARGQSLTQYYLTVKSGFPEPEKRRSEPPCVDLLQSGHRSASV